MTTDLPVAIAVAGWILTFCTSLVVTGTVVDDGRPRVLGRTRGRIRVSG